MLCVRSYVYSLCGLRIFYFRRCFSIKNNNSKDLFSNEDIKSGMGFAPNKIIRVIGSDGEQLGLMQLSAALDEAYDKGYDLVLISPKAEPPVCRIMDYGKFRFERDKREKEARKKQQTMDVKEIQLTCRIDTNDFNTKVNHAIRFLSAGNKVKVMVKFKGRQMAHTDIGRELLDKFRESCAEHGTVDKPPVLEGRNMTMFLGPLKQQTSSKGKNGSVKEKNASAENNAKQGTPAADKAE